MQGIVDLKQMPVADKFILMEQLWDDLSQDIYADDLIPNWHLDILKKRELNKDSKFISLETLKQNLQNLVKS